MPSARRTRHAARRRGREGARWNPSGATQRVGVDEVDVVAALGEGRGSPPRGRPRTSASSGSAMTDGADPQDPGPGCGDEVDERIEDLFGDRSRARSARPRRSRRGPPGTPSDRRRRRSGRGRCAPGPTARGPGRPSSRGRSGPEREARRGPGRWRRWRRPAGQRPLPAPNRRRSGPGGAQRPGRGWCARRREDRGRRPVRRRPGRRRRHRRPAEPIGGGRPSPGPRPGDGHSGVGGGAARGVGHRGRRAGWPARRSSSRRTTASASGARNSCRRPSSYQIVRMAWHPRWCTG